MIAKGIVLRILVGERLENWKRLRGVVPLDLDPGLRPAVVGFWALCGWRCSPFAKLFGVFAVFRQQECQVVEYGCVIRGFQQRLSVVGDGLESFSC